MKRKALLLAVAFATFVFVNTYAQKDRKLSNGFSVMVTLGMPSAEYGIGGNEALDGHFSSNGFMSGIQIGNRWYFNPTEEYGFGLMVNWFDFTYAQKNKDNSALGTIDFSICEIGPIGTYVLNNEMAIDGYYNLRPTLISSVVLEDKNDSDSGWGAASFGITHAIGAAFRYKAFSVGLEQVFGKLKGADMKDTEDMNEIIGQTDLLASNFRILLGFKF